MFLLLSRFLVVLVFCHGSWIFGFSSRFLVVLTFHQDSWFVWLFATVNGCFCFSTRFLDFWLFRHGCWMFWLFKIFSFLSFFFLILFFYFFIFQYLLKFDIFQNILIITKLRSQSELVTFFSWREHYKLKSYSNY